MKRRTALQKTGVLMGGVLAMPTVLSMLTSCKSENRLEWRPEFLTIVEAETVAKLVDLILPKTNTPGALDVGVDIFIDRFVARAYEKQEQDNVRHQLSLFNENCKQEYGDFFIDLNQENQIAILRNAEKTSGKFNLAIWGISIGEQKQIGFYRSLKSMAIWAYFTSERVGEHVLNYDPIPGLYDGCLPLAEVGNRWTF